MRPRRTTGNTTSRRRLGGLLLVVALFSNTLSAQPAATTRTLSQLTSERLMLTAELNQFQTTLDMVHTDGTPPEQSPNSAVRTLAIGAVALKRQLIAITEQEVALLQQQIITSRQHTYTPDNAVAAVATAEPNRIASEPEAPAANTHRDTTGDKPTRAQEAETVERLHNLLENYYVELEESDQILPTAEEIAQREAARHDAATLNEIPFSVDKIRLSGPEGSAALARISQRLVDPRIPESRRDVAPICTIKTRLLDTLIGVENRSLKPVGKNHYILRVRLQPGDTTISILSDQWEVQLPQDGNAQDFLITLYNPVGGTPELHVFAVDDLLATGKPHIPAWLPEELGLKTTTG